MAREIPVLPLVASRMIRSGVSSPDSSAASIIRLAIRSFSEPVGLSPSSFAHSRTDGFGDIRGMPTSRVLPIASRMSFARMREGLSQAGPSALRTQVVGTPLGGVALGPGRGDVAVALARVRQSGVGGAVARVVVQWPRPAEHVASYQLEVAVDRDHPFLDRRRKQSRGGAQALEGPVELGEILLLDAGMTPRHPGLLPEPRGDVLERTAFDRDAAHV